MAKDKDDDGRYDDDALGDGDELTAEGSVGPGRGTPLKRLPPHSVYTIFAGPLDDKGRPVPPKSEEEAEQRRKGREKLRQIAIWGAMNSRTEGYTEDVIQTIMFAFARHAIPSGTRKRDVLKAAATTAKRWAVEEKRLLHYPVVLDRKDHFDKACRDSCSRADNELGMDEDASDPFRHDDFVDSLEADADTDGIDWTNIPPKMATAINKAWREVHPRVARVMRHLLMGEPILRAAELESVAYQTAVTHMRTFMKAAQSHL